MSKSGISLRTAGFIGATIFFFGSFSTIFISNIGQLSFTFGILQGVGFGIIVPILYSTVNFYFVKKRISIMSACKATQGLILMWYPQFIKKIIVQYGFRGTLLLISGVSLHMIPGVATMITPDKKQRKKPPSICSD